MSVQAPQDSQRGPQTQKWTKSQIAGAAFVTAIIAAVIFVNVIGIMAFDKNYPLGEKFGFGCGIVVVTEMVGLFFLALANVR